MKIQKRGDLHKTKRPCIDMKKKITDFVILAANIRTCTILTIISNFQTHIQFTINCIAHRITAITFPGSTSESRDSGFKICAIRIRYFLIAVVFL